MVMHILTCLFIHLTCIQEVDWIRLRCSTLTPCDDRTQSLLNTSESMDGPAERPAENPSNSERLGVYHRTVSGLTVGVYWRPGPPIWQRFAFDPDLDPMWRSGTVAGSTVMPEQASIALYMNHCHNTILQWLIIVHLTSLTLSWYSFYGWGRVHFTLDFAPKGSQYSIYRCLQPVLIEMTNDAKLKIVDTHFQNGAITTSLSLLPIKAANTFIIYNHNHITS